MILGRGIYLSSLAALFVAALMLLGCSAGQKKPVEHLFYSAVFTLDDSTYVTVLTEKVDGGLVVKNGEEDIFVKSLGDGCYSVPVFGGSWTGGVEWGSLDGRVGRFVKN